MGERYRGLPGYRVGVDGLTDLGERIVGILGEGASRDLLDAITRPERMSKRAVLIGRL